MDYNLTRDLTNKLLVELDSEKFQDFNPDLLLLNECDKFEYDYENPDFYLAIEEIFFELQEVLDETREEKDLDNYEN